MNLKLVTLPNERSCRFESPDIGPVPKLCLSVASNNLGTRMGIPAKSVRDFFDNTFFAARWDHPAFFVLVAHVNH